MHDISRFDDQQRQVLARLRSSTDMSTCFLDIIVLLLDVSSSMAGEKIREARRAVLAFVSRLNKMDCDIFLASFSDETEVQELDLKNTGSVALAVRRLEADGGTSLYGALQHVHESFLKGKEHQNRTIVLATDGEPTDAPKERIEEYAILLRTEGIRIVTIAIGEDCDHAFLSHLASAGSDAHHADAGQELKPVYEQIADQLQLPPGAEATARGRRQ